MDQASFNDGDLITLHKQDFPARLRYLDHQIIIDRQPVSGEEEMADSLVRELWVFRAYPVVAVQKHKSLPVCTDKKVNLLSKSFVIWHDGCFFRIGAEVDCLPETQLGFAMSL
jgi:hypothetical protein